MACIFREWLFADLESTSAGGLAGTGPTSESGRGERLGTNFWRLGEETSGNESSFGDGTRILVL
jgi:hypothetical protein